MNEIYGKPFQAAITQAQLRGVMPCYCSYDGQVASASKELLTETLRGEMGFDGVVLSDYSAISNAHNVQGLFENMGETGLAAKDADLCILTLGASIGFQNYVNCPHEPRYRFGHGLSYTSFAYSELNLSTKELDPQGQTEITLKVKNTGHRAGTEIVQLYIRDVHASMIRPCMELAGWRRVELQPGEEQQVSFGLQASQLAFLDLDCRWKVEKGEVELLVGASSEDICLRDSINVSASTFIDGKSRAFWA